MGWSSVVFKRNNKEKETQESGLDSLWSKIDDQIVIAKQAIANQDFKSLLQVRDEVTELQHQIVQLESR
jgi:hypothetical protein